MKQRRKINVKEKFGDYLLDISKYVFTAVIITTLFNEIEAVQYLVYIVGLLGTVVTLLLALFYFYK